jgi:anti-sigma-K factor RskA
MVQDDHRRYEEDLAAYLLDALALDEAREFRAHLEGCARCQRDERWLRAAAEMLPSSVEQYEPSPALRKRVMDRVHVEAANDRASAREKLPRRRPWRWTVVRTAAAAAAIAIAITSPLAYLLGNDEETKTTTRTIQATATPEEPTAKASVIRTGDTAELKVNHLPVQRQGHVYKTWLKRGKQFVPSTIFAVGKDGSGSTALKGSLEGVSAVLVTEESDGATPQPTSKPVLIANL